MFSHTISFPNRASNPSLHSSSPISFWVGLGLLRKRLDENVGDVASNGVVLPTRDLELVDGRANDKAVLHQQRVVPEHHANICLGAAATANAMLRPPVTVLAPPAKVGRRRLCAWRIVNAKLRDDQGQRAVCRCQVLPVVLAVPTRHPALPCAVVKAVVQNRGIVLVQSENALRGQGKRRRGGAGKARDRVRRRRCRRAKQKKKKEASSTTESATLLMAERTCSKETELAAPCVRSLHQWPG